MCLFKSSLLLLRAFISEANKINSSNKTIGIIETLNSKIAVAINTLHNCSIFHAIVIVIAGIRVIDYNENQAKQSQTIHFPQKVITFRRIILKEIDSNICTLKLFCQI